MSKGRTHTIIGNSAAALSAVKAIRRAQDSSPILLISAENCNAYSPVLTTYYIAGEIERSDLFFVDDSFYDEYQVRTVLGRQVMEIDTAKRLVYLDRGSKIGYENLLIATGASARSLENVDPDARNYVSTLRTIDDADRIRKAIEKAKTIVVTGAGLVSLQTIKAILGRGLEITAVVGSEQVLSQQMDAESASMVQEKLEAQGVTILFGRAVDRVIRKGERVQVVTNYGESLPADLVIVGKGVRSNVGLVQGTGIELRDGILVDERMRTNLEDVFAAGDVAEGRNSITGQMEIMATWLSACAQGEIAGLNMAGFEAERKGQFRENVTTILGLAVASMGVSRPEEGAFKEIRHIDSRRSVYRRLVLDGPRLVGALLVGRIQDAGVVRHCIANQVDISPWEDRIAMAPLDFGSIIFGKNGWWPIWG
jgi:NAD(P)H-nitrite reductase large subunit